MIEQKKVTCPLDCFDLCLMDVRVVDGVVTSISGNKDHPLTCGVLCKKGKDHLKRHLDPQRIKTPMLRKGDQWQELTQEDAMGILAEKMMGIDSRNILYYTDSGHNGLSKNAAELFFQRLGPITTHRGSLCWNAGNFGLEKSIGEHAGVRHFQIQEADEVIFWGRNALETNLHLYLYVKKMGKPFLYIDPIATKTAQAADEYLQIKANSDLELAAGVMKLLVDGGFLQLNPEERKLVERISMEDVCNSTGLSQEQLESLARRFRGDRNIITFIGYGLQRYKNGARAVEGIIALHFLSGMVNKPGCGFHFSDKRIAKSLAKPFAKKEVVNETFVKSTFGAYVQTRKDWSLLFVDKSNPMVQLPDTQEVRKAFERFPFKVGVDLFMTDTMKAMDLVFPAPSPFECADVVVTSMFSPYLQYTQACVESGEQVLSEYELFQRLAEMIGMDDYPQVDLDRYLYLHMEPVLKLANLSWESFKEVGWMDPEPEKEKNRPLEWKTPGVQIFAEMTPKKTGIQDPYKYRLITPHWKDSLHSQGFKDVHDLPKIYMNEPGFATGEKVIVQSTQGALTCVVEVDPRLQTGLVYIYEGYWQHSGIVNTLTTDAYSDEGDQAAYYETLVSVVKENARRS